MQIQSHSDIINRFVKSAEALTATVEIIYKNTESLTQALVTAAENKTILLAEPNYLNPDLFAEFRRNDNVVTNPNKEQLINLKVGVTDAFCGIASTGSVCVPVANNLTSAASMLTRKHIIVVDGKTIIPRPRDVFSEKYLDGKGLSQSFSIITGPSATADMGPLVRGVHGPGRIHIIVLE